MNRLPLGLCLAAVFATCSVPALAAESYGDYDTFSTSYIRPEKWLGRERTRVITGNALRLIQRDYGDQADDIGIFNNSHGLGVSNPAAVTQLQASVKVNGHEVTGCGAGVSDVQARLIGAFFNTGPVTSGSRVNDILGLVRLIRQSDSADPPDTLRAEGLLVKCTSSDCNSSEAVGSAVALGTVTVGTQVTLRVVWDQPNKKFFYRLNDTTIAAPYSVSDAFAPQQPFKDLQTRTRLANCKSGAPTTGMMDATFDSVYVNASAAP
jgi:hypothetical protein